MVYYQFEIWPQPNYSNALQATARNPARIKTPARQTGTAEITETKRKRGF